ncbi:hypothetical protein [Roseovarius aquimarinus]|uniref:DUF3619 family protein n=1 Tax=Roseovarius aquimarinus TaxID=1229156 RepID=A0ABW7IAJ4_9RHOB
MTDDRKADAAALAALSQAAPARPSAALMRRIAADAAVLAELRAARAGAPAPSDMLMARIARDAAAHRPRRAPRPAIWGGLVAAGLAGLAFGLADPAGLGTAVWPGGDTLAMTTLIPAYDFQYLEVE